MYCATSKDPILTERGMTSEADNCYFGSGCKCESPSSYALDPMLGKWLWQWSSEAVKLPKEFQLLAQG